MRPEPLIKIKETGPALLNHCGGWGHLELTASVFLGGRFSTRHFLIQVGLQMSLWVPLPCPLQLLLWVDCDFGRTPGSLVVAVKTAIYLSQYDDRLWQLKVVFSWLIFRVKRECVYVRERAEGLIKVKCMRLCHKVNCYCKPSMAAQCSCCHGHGALSCQVEQTCGPYSSNHRRLQKRSMSELIDGHVTYVCDITPSRTLDWMIKSQILHKQCYSKTSDQVF